MLAVNWNPVYGVFIFPCSYPNVKNSYIKKHKINEFLIKIELNTMSYIQNIPQSFKMMTYIR